MSALGKEVSIGTPFDPANPPQKNAHPQILARVQKFICEKINTSA